MVPGSWLDRAGRDGRWIHPFDPAARTITTSQDQPVSVQRVKQCREDTCARTASSRDANTRVHRSAKDWREAVHSSPLSAPGAGGARPERLLRRSHEEEFRYGTVLSMTQPRMT